MDTQDTKYPYGHTERYVIPLFDGIEDDTADKINAVLKKFKAYALRTCKKYGVISFRLPNEVNWNEFCDTLGNEVHENCFAWSYRTLDRLSCDHREKTLEAMRNFKCPPPHNGKPYNEKSN